MLICVLGNQSYSDYHWASEYIKYACFAINFFYCNKILLVKTVVLLFFSLQSILNVGHYFKNDQTEMIIGSKTKMQEKTACKMTLSKEENDIVKTTNQVF